MKNKYKKRAYRYFIIALIITKDYEELQAHFKDARLRAFNDTASLLKKLERNEEIKGNRIDETLKEKIYTDLVAYYQTNQNFEIGLIVVDNKKLKPIFFENKALSFNYFLSAFMKSFKETSTLAATNESESIWLLIDDRNVAPDHKNSLQDYLNTQLRIHDRVFAKKIRAGYCNSKRESLIQLADFVSNTVVRALNHQADKAQRNLDILRPLLNCYELQDINKNKNGSYEKLK
jgi:hypothetical protein